MYNFREHLARKRLFRAFERSRIRDTVSCNVLRTFNAILCCLKIKLHIKFIFDILRDYIIMYGTSNLCWEERFDNYYICRFFTIQSFLNFEKSTIIIIFPKIISIYRNLNILNIITAKEPPVYISERSIPLQSSEEEDWEATKCSCSCKPSATLRTYRSKSEPSSITRLITL